MQRYRGIGWKVGLIVCYAELTRDARELLSCILLHRPVFDDSTCKKQHVYLIFIKLHACHHQQIVYQKHGTYCNGELEDIAFTIIVFSIFRNQGYLPRKTREGMAQWFNLYFLSLFTSYFVCLFCVVVIYVFSSVYVLFYLHLWVN